MPIQANETRSAMTIPVRSNRVLVTGATGFIGNAIVQGLVEAGLDATDVRQALGATGTLKDPRYFHAKEMLALDAMPSTIVHCSGNSSIRHSFADPLADLRAGLQQTCELLEFIRLRGGSTRLLFLSSSAVYGDAAEPRDEFAALAPVSPYGLHKMLAEEAVRFYGRVHGVRSAVLRPLSVYGAGQRKQLIWDALCRFERGDFHFLGGGTNVRDFIDVRDVASFVPFAIEAASSEVPIFNVSTGTSTSVRDAMTLLAQLWGSPSGVTFGDAVWPGDPRVLVGMNDRARALGWAPTVDLAKGFASVVQWFRQVRGQ
jgi:UDP-glucose 4-epimerase